MERLYALDHGANRRHLLFLYLYDSYPDARSEYLDEVPSLCAVCHIHGVYRGLGCQYRATLAGLGLFGSALESVRTGLCILLADVVFFVHATLAGLSCASPHIYRLETML